MSGLSTVVEPYRHRGRALFRLLFGLCLFTVSAGISRAQNEDRLYVGFTRRNSTKFKGILLRDSQKHYTVATAEKVIEISRLDARPDKGFVTQTQRLDGLFDSVERWIERGRFGPARDDQKRIKTAMGDFDKLVANDLFSSTSSAGFKAAIRQAKKYYQSKSAAIEPTIMVLEICKEIKALLDEISAGKRKPSRDLLLNMASLLGKLEAVKEPTPLADVKRGRVEGSMQRSAEKCLTILTSKAVANFAEAWDITSSRELMKTMAACAKAKTGYDDAQGPLIKALNEKAAAFARTFPQAAREIYKYDGQVTLDLEPYKKKLRKMRAINAALDDIREMTYGPRKEAYSNQLEQRVKANNAEVAKGDKIRDLIYDIRKDYAVAIATLEKGEYTTAKVKLQALDKKVTPSGLKVQTLRLELTRLVLKADGSLLLKELREVGKKTPGAAMDLLKRAKKFRADYGNRFKEIELDVTDFNRKITQLEGYRGLLIDMREIQTGVAEKPKQTWVRILDVGEKMEKATTSIHPRGKPEWDAFLKANQGKAFEAVMDLFKKNGVDAADGRDRDVIISCMEYLLKRDRNRDAAAFIGDLSDKLKQKHTNPFAKELVDLEMQAAQKISAGGDFKSAAAIYYRIKVRWPDHPLVKKFDKLLAGLLLLQAKEQEKTGKTEDALATYSKITREFSPHARTETFDAILRLKLATDETMAKDSVAWRKFLETFCLEFQERVNETKGVAAVKEQIKSEYLANWEEKDEVVAVSEFLKFYAGHPNLARISGVGPVVVMATKAKLQPVYKNEKKVGSLKTLKCLRLLLSDEFKAVAVKMELDDMYVTFRLRQADNLLAIKQVGNVDRAYGIYEEIKKDFPDKANANGVDETMKKWRRRRLLDQFCRPLRIYGKADWIAFGFWILFWLWYSVRAIGNGRKYGHLRNSIWHFVTVFSSFSVLLVILLIGGGEGSFQHAVATALALLVPGLIFMVLGLFNGFGLFPYVFFPLIYARRRLNLTRLVLKVGRWVPGVKSRLDPLKRNLAELEADLPLLHDRWLFRIARAARLAEEDQEKAFATFQKLNVKLEKELVKDEAWEEHRTNCLFNLGQLAWSLKRGDEAKAYLNEHMEKDPRSMETRELLAEIHYSLGEHEEAVPHLKVCLAAQSTNDTLWHRLGRCFFETKKYKSSFKCFETMQQPTRDSMFYGARAFANVGMHQRSVDWYQRLLKLNAEDGEAIYFLASSFAQLGEDVKAFKIIALVKSEDSYYPHALALQGSLLYRNRKFDKAEEYYKAALEYDSTLPQALLGQGQLALETGRTDDAAKHLSALVGRVPDSAPGNYFYGVVLEKQGDDKALTYLAKSLESSTFKRQSANHMGRVHFFGQNYTEAIKFFETANEAGERSPWFLYLYAYALACVGQLERCDQVVINIFGHTAPDREWQQRAASAMYTLGYKLFELEDYTLAGKCFEYVKANCGETAPVKLEELVEESRFRTIVAQIQKGDYGQAANVVAELQLSTQNQSRFAACRYYAALCDLYQKQYESAHQPLKELVEKDSDNPRFLYHLAVAELGMGNRKETERLIDRVSKMQDAPKHIQVGTTTVKAYCMSEDGKEREAEQILADVRDTKEDFPGNDYVAQRVLLTRAYYLCKIQDSARLQFLHGEMSDSTRSQAAYMQALSCLEGGHLSAAINNLRPYANESRNNTRLYTTLATELAATAVRDGNAKRAAEVLESIPDPPAVVVSAMEALRMARTLKDSDTIEGLGSAVAALQQSLTKTRDSSLVHSIKHNLSVLILRLAMLVEDTRDKENVEECWQNFWAFWEQNVFDDNDYWRLCHERVAAEGDQPYSFTPDEVARLNGSLREDILMKIFMGFVLAYLHETGSQTDLLRHLNYFTQMGQQDDKLSEYMKRLGREAKIFVDGIEKSDPILKTWDFVIGYMRLQVAVAEVTRPDELPSLQDQLETYLEFRNHYAAPSDYMQAKKVFNTKLLDTLQEGINGKFSVAGDRLDKVLSEIPHGVSIDPILQPLWDLRETCRKPSAALERGVNLVMEFERMYQRVVNFSLQKGK